jgi:hypothetical protein
LLNEIDEIIIDGVYFFGVEELLQGIVRPHRGNLREKKSNVVKIRHS